ncbi:hypothetical protein N9Y42_06450 [Mariniblastus sp.]|nr:hypothetical protein [Mariniblastus sp.]
MKKTQPVIRAGKIVNAFTNQITWLCDEGNEQQHTLAKGATITLDGQPSKLDRLRVGMPVRVTFCAEDHSQTSCIAAKKIKKIPFT